jgi:hypothetical protein
VCAIAADQARPERPDMNTDSSLLNHPLRSAAGGTYRTNLALIALSPHHSLWYPGNDPTLARWCIFAHEYAHFLHYFSTISGLQDFVSHLRLMGLFGRTVGVDGTSRGSAALNETDTLDFARWQRWLKHLRGSGLRPFDPDYHRRNVTLRITGVAMSRETIHFSTQHDSLPLEDARVSFTVSSASTPEERCDTVLGSWHIMETLAYEIEKTIVKAHGAQAALGEDTTPPFPYKFGRILFEHLSESVPSEEVLTRVCLMALQSTDPGAAFIDIAKAFATRPAGEPDPVTVKRFEGITLAEFRRTFVAFSDLTLKREYEVFVARGGPVGQAIQTLGEMCQRYVELRSTDHFFELRMFEQIVDRESLHDLLKTYPPCPLVHEAALDGQREFFQLSVTELSADAVDALSVYQTWGQFMLAHVRPDRFLATNECRSPRCQCLFFGACAAPQARAAPQLCQSAPWRAFRPDDPVGCVYAAGVAAARGRADL